MADLTQTSSVHKSIYLTKRGNFIPKVEEIYLRRDIPCGYKDCILCLKKLDFFNFDDEIQTQSQIIEESKGTTHSHKNLILVLDLVGLINSLDCLLSSDLFPNQVIPHSILSWFQKNSKSGFKKLKTFLELDNHGQMRVFPDKFCADLSSIHLEFPSEQKSLLTGSTVNSIESCARMAAYFASHLSFLRNFNVIILSDNERLRVLEQVKSQSPSLSRVSICNLSEYLRNFVNDEANIQTVLDCVPPSMNDMKTQLIEHSRFISNQEQFNEFINTHSYMNNSNINLSSPNNFKQENEQILKEKKAKEELMLKVNSGLLFRGKLRVSRNNPTEGTVGCRVLGRDVQISGINNLNFAIHGDFVAVEVFPVSEWIPLEKADLKLEEESNEAFSNPLQLSDQLNQGRKSLFWLI
jgi:hypothetical protein